MILGNIFIIDLFWQSTVRSILLIIIIIIIIICYFILFYFFNNSTRNVWV